MKHTAVDWLFTQLWEKPKDKFEWQYVLNKAKEMEKEQIGDAYDEAYGDGYVDNGKSSEEYYKETYE